MKYKSYILLLFIVTALTACGTTKNEEEQTTEIQTDVISTLHVEMNDEIEQKQENFYKISNEYEKYLVDFSAYNVEITPELFIQIYDENGNEKYYVKANGDGTQYKPEQTNFDYSYSYIILSNKNEYYIALDKYRDVSVTEWENGDKDGLYYYDEGLNEIHPQNLINAISVTDFAKYCNVPEEKMLQILKSSAYNFSETYSEELKTLMEYESDWNDWMHSSYIVKDGAIYSGLLSDDYINSVLKKQGDLDEQNRQILLAEKETLGVEKVYPIINKDDSISFVSQTGEDMTAIYNEESNETDETSTEDSTEEEESKINSTKIKLPDKLISKDNVEYVPYSILSNKDENNNVYYEIVPVKALQSQLSYIKIYYDINENLINISGIKYKDIQETIDTLDKFYLSLEDIKTDKDKNSFITIGTEKQPIKFYLYDPKDAYINKKIFALDEKLSCIYIVIKEEDFSSMVNDISEYKELSYDEFNIVYDKFKTLIKQESVEEITEMETDSNG